MKKAFSLVELLVSLITISVILASLAPVITHKLKQNRITVGFKGENVTNDCSPPFGSDCQLCNKNKCLICPLSCSDGKYLDKDNCQCLSCPNNCKKCDETGCSQCNSGYKKQGNTCTACPAGYWGENCVNQCPKGTMANAPIAATGCIDCTGNQFQDQVGQIACKNCSGFVGDNNTKCTTCSPGTYWNGSSCQNCSAGTFSNTTNATRCQYCNRGFYQDEDGKDKCKECLAGTYSRGSGAVTSCTTCPPGSFSDKNGATGCTNCSGFGSNYYQSEYGQTKCELCNGLVKFSETACEPCSIYYGEDCISCTLTQCTKIKNCKQLSQNGKKCLECEFGYEFSEVNDRRICKLPNDRHCIEKDDKGFCTKCATGYNLVASEKKLSCNSVQNYCNKNCKIVGGTTTCNGSSGGMTICSTEGGEKVCQKFEGTVTKHIAIYPFLRCIHESLNTSCSQKLSNFLNNNSEGNILTNVTELENCTDNMIDNYPDVSGEHPYIKPSP